MLFGYVVDRGVDNWLVDELRYVVDAREEAIRRSA